MGQLLQWLGFERREDSPPPRPPQGSGVIPPARSDFTVDAALSLGPVYRSLSILSTAASQLTLDAWRGDESLDPKPSLIRKPDPDSNLSAFLAESVTSMATSGNLYWRYTRNARHEVTGAQVLDPWTCTPSTDGKTLSVAGRTRPLGRGEFAHLKLLRVPGRTLGLGPIQAARADLQGARDLRDYASQWFTSGDTPSGILKSDQPLTAEQASTYKSQWHEREAHEVAVLGSGLDYRPILLSPEDAQFLEVRQFSVTEIARMFGIPARLLLAAIEGSSMTYSNLAQEDLTFVRWTLMAYLRPIEEALTAALPGVQSARFNLDAVLRPDTKSRAEAHGMAIEAGWMTVNEVRAIEGLPPLSIPTPRPVEETP